MKRGVPTTKETHEIRFGSERIQCELVRSSATRLRLIVTPELQVTMKVPRGCSAEDALLWASRRAGWIVRQQDYFREFLPRPEEKRYVSGESFRYLGRQYRLKVTKGRPQATLSAGFLRVAVENPRDSSAIERLLREWYRRRSLAVFNARLDECMKLAGRHGIKRPILRRRWMLRRWGSCHLKSGMLLNTRLVTAPMHCIDYVIIHELTHLRVPNHSQEFYRLLSLLLPDWETRKHRLERMTAEFC
ncbi:MAG: SprT family zinc-dependent metalloprotease [Phycisphaerae bacterium]